MQNTRKSLVQVSFRIPKTLKELVEQYVKNDLHVNVSDFFREALREKIQRDAPQLYQALLKHD